MTLFLPKFRGYSGTFRSYRPLKVPERRLVMSGKEIHLYLDESELGSVIHIHVGREPDSGLSAPRRHSVEAMTELLTAHSNGANTLAMIDGLRALGCKLVAPEVRRPGKRPEKYLNVYAPAGPRGAMLYLYPERAHFYRRTDRERLAAMDGAEVRGDYVSFDTTTPEGVQHALAAAQAVSRTPGASEG
jgi:hypothetical protein